MREGTFYDDAIYHNEIDQNEVDHDIGYQHCGRVTQSAFRITNEGLPSLYVRRLCGDDQGPVVVLWPGFGESSDVFGRTDEEGFAFTLAESGFDVFAVDPRGHGQSLPLVDDHHECDVQTVVQEDIARVADWIERDTAVLPHLWIGSGVGAWFIAAALARFSRLRRHTLGWVGVNPNCLEAFHPFSRWVMRQCIRRERSLPQGWVSVEPEWFGVVSDCEQWASQDHWFDPNDGFDYTGAWHDHAFPPAMLFVAECDERVNAKTALEWLERMPGQSAPVIKVPNAEDGRQLLKDYDTQIMVAERVCQWVNEQITIRGCAVEPEKQSIESHQATEEMESYFTQSISPSTYPEYADA